MDVDTSWRDISQASLMESDDEDIFASIDLSSISDPSPKIIHLDCHKDTSNYNDWVADKCFTNAFPIDESCLFDPELLRDFFNISRQTILELKVLGHGQEQQQSKRLTVTNLLHFVHNEVEHLNVAQDLLMLKSLLDHPKFLPTAAQDSKQYIHGYFEWKLLLALIAIKTEGAAELVKDLLIQLVSHSINRLADYDLRTISPFPCDCFVSLWSVIIKMTEKLSSELSIWSLLELAMTEYDRSVMDVSNRNNKGKKYRDISLLHLWFLRHIPKCLSAGDTSLHVEHREIVSRSFLTFLEREPPEVDLRVALHELKIFTRTQQLNVETIIQLWEYLYKKINTNFKTINLDSTNSLLVPNDTSLSYINKIRAMAVNNSAEEENVNLTSYELFLEMVTRGWQRATEDADPKYQQKLANRLLLKFSTKMWVSMNEMGIHNLINLLLVLYYLGGGDDRCLDRVENILLTVPFAEINHNRRMSVFKGLTAVLIMMYGKADRNKSKGFPENFMKKFENSIGVDRLTGRQMIVAVDTIFAASEAMANKEFSLINPWIKLYLNVCTDNDRDILMETLTRILVKYQQLKGVNEDAEEVLRRIYQVMMESVIMSYLNADQEVEVTGFIANFILCCRQPIQGVPLVDTLFTNFVLNNIKNPRTQLTIANKVAAATVDVGIDNGGAGVVHVNNWIKALIKFMLVIDGPAMTLRPILNLINNSKEFPSFCSMDSEEFLSSQQPFAVFLKGIRSVYETLSTDSDRDRFYNRFEMYFQMYTKWCLPHMKTAEEAMKCYGNTTAVIFICGKVIYNKRASNSLKTLIGDFYLTSALLGRKAQPPVVIKAMFKVMHSLLGGLFQLEATLNDQYLNSVIGDLIFHWTPQFATEFNVPGSILPYLKFTRAHLNTQLPSVLYDRMCQVLLTSQLQRDVLGVKLIAEALKQSKDDVRAVRVLLNGVLLRLLEYYCKCEDFASVKKLILDFLDELSSLNFLLENVEVARVLDSTFERWALSMLHTPNFFELAIKLARLFPVNLRMIMPRLRAEISGRNQQLGGNHIAIDRLNQKMRNLEMILQQK